MTMLTCPVFNCSYGGQFENERILILHLEKYHPRSVKKHGLVSLVESAKSISFLSQ